jgi:hypothetical protein
MTGLVLSKNMISNGLSMLSPYAKRTNNYLLFLYTNLDTYKGADLGYKT